MLLHFRIYAHTHTTKQASKLFCFHRVFTIILLFTNHHPLYFFLTHTYTLLYAAHRKGPCCAARTFAYERVFSIHFAAAAITIRHHIHSRRRRTHAHTHIKQSRAPYTHIHDRYSGCASYLKKEARRESRDIHTYIHIYTSCACVFSRCRFFLLARQQRENDTPLTDWVTFLSLSVCV